MHKRSFARRWIEKFLDNWDKCIEDNNKISLKIVYLNSIFYGNDHIYKNFKKLAYRDIEIPPLPLFSGGIYWKK